MFPGGCSFTDAGLLEALTDHSQSTVAAAGRSCNRPLSLAVALPAATPPTTSWPLGNTCARWSPGQSHSHHRGRSEFRVRLNTQHGWAHAFDEACCAADKDGKKGKDPRKAAAAAAAELSAGQARQVKAEEKRQKAKDAERQAMGSYMQVGFRSHDQTVPPDNVQYRTGHQACSFARCLDRIRLQYLCG